MTQIPANADPAAFPSPPSLPAPMAPPERPTDRLGDPPPPTVDPQAPQVQP